MQRNNKIQCGRLLTRFFSTLLIAWLVSAASLDAQGQRYPLPRPNPNSPVTGENGIAGNATSSPRSAAADSTRGPEDIRMASRPEDSGELPKEYRKGTAPDRQGFFELGRILATVAGEPIFFGDLIGDVNREIERVAADAPEAIKEQNRPKLMQQMLPMAIEQKLVYVDMLRKLPDQTRITQLRKDIMDQYDKVELPKLMKDMKVSSRDELDLKLRGLGTSLRSNRDKWVDNQIVAIFVQQFVGEKKTVTRREMLEEYNLHKEEYAIPAKVRWEELMISFEKTGSKDEAWKQIAELGNDVIFGASLSALAKEKSHGYGAKEGGEHDWTEKGSLVHKEIDKLLFELPVNYLSDIIETKLGYHIVRVLERTEAGYVPFTEAQQEIKQRLEGRYRKERLGEYLDKLRQEIPVEIYDEEAAKVYALSKRR